MVRALTSRQRAPGWIPVLGPQGPGGGRRDAVVAQNPVERVLGGVVALGDLGAVPLGEDQLLLGEQVIGEALVERPDGVQRIEFRLGVCPSRSP